MGLNDERVLLKSLGSGHGEDEGAQGKMQVQMMVVGEKRVDIVDDTCLFQIRQTWRKVAMTTQQVTNTEKALYHGGLPVSKGK